MKIIETISKSDLYKNSMVGVFKNAILDTDNYYDLELGRGYYITRSQSKNVVKSLYDSSTDIYSMPWEVYDYTPAWVHIPIDYIEKIYSEQFSMTVIAYDNQRDDYEVGRRSFETLTPELFRKEFPNANSKVTILFEDTSFPVEDVLIWYDITLNKNEIFNLRMGEYIRGQFKTKWDRIYTSLTSQYNPINNYEYSETISADNKDTIKYGSEMENNSNRNINETTTDSITRENEISGFNSLGYVDDTKSTDDVTRSYVADKENNTTNSTSVKSGQDETNKIRDERITREGRRDSSPAKLIEQELNMRDKLIFYDIVYKDIDSVIALKIY